MMDSLKTDVVVVGGGPAGLAMAAALGAGGLRVICCDREALSTMTGAAFDGRTTALVEGSRRILAEMGVWAALEEHASPMMTVRIVDHDESAPLIYQAKEGDALGWVIENRFLRRVLAEKMAMFPHVKHLDSVSVTDIKWADKGAVVTLADGRTIAARLVIGADGRSSVCRQMAGIGTRKNPYDQTAVVAVLSHEKPHNGLSLEHYWPGGPLAVIPLVGNRSSLIWCERSGEAQRLLSLPEDQFIATLQRQMGAEGVAALGDISLMGKRFSYPLALEKAEHLTAPRLALIGETAHILHPIAAQGYNLTLRDVAALAAEVLGAARVGLDFGDQLVLDAYARQRQGDIGLMGFLTDGMVRLFSNENKGLLFVRNKGLSFLEKEGFLKTMMMRYAQGLVFPRPAGTV